MHADGNTSPVKPSISKNDVKGQDSQSGKKATVTWNKSR